MVRPLLVGLLYCALGYLATMETVRADIAVITHTGNPLGTLATTDIKRLFLKHTAEFPDGNRAMVSTLPAHLPLTQAFYRNILRMTESQLKTYWARYIFSGQKSPPPELTDQLSMRLWVSQTEGSVGFIDVDLVDDSVKVLRTLRVDHENN